MTTTDQHIEEAKAAMAAIDEALEAMEKAGQIGLTKEEARLRRIRSYSNGRPRRGRGEFC